MGEANGVNLTMDLGENTQSTTSENMQMQKCRRWKDSEDTILLKQCRGSDPAEWERKKDEMWAKIHGAMTRARLVGIFQHALDEQCLLLLRNYRANNRLDEWKSGDAGQFSEAGLTHCDILS